MSDWLQDFDGSWSDLKSKLTRTHAHGTHTHTHICEYTIPRSLLLLTLHNFLPSLLSPPLPLSSTIYLSIYGFFLFLQTLSLFSFLLSLSLILSLSHYFASLIPLWLYTKGKSLELLPIHFIRNIFELIKNFPHFQEFWILKVNSQIKKIM